MKIVAEYWPPPIPQRDFDWCAIDEDRYDVDCDQGGYFAKSPIGYGRTREAAVADLLEQLGE